MIFRVLFYLFQKILAD